MWVPAEELAEFNAQYVGKIRVIEAYFGEGFTGYIPERFGLAGKNASEQLITLAGSWEYSSFDFALEIAANRLAIFLHFPYWTQRNFEQDGIAIERKNEVLEYVQQAWAERYPDMPLCYATGG